ncbi:hypothetical protein IMCC20628_02906 [Hoeflea sp. IMCC20628]|uniref:hypothetical protein n=1 Tax=Hoeflea sp. IMCC20628 TaxID=1620421 RepID=UPI00063A869F|nr:hypothetical protein [Hoeflea sp. IMCC20628]AKI01601.1 hypothetical protein IMCC20628_02906 [Hoeflea sp. IMCC20628]
MTIHSFDSDPVSLSIDASVGHIAGLTIRDGARILTPLHRAPWVDDPAVTFPVGTAPNVQRLSGDFFCAPFGRNDIEDAPSHGWPANSEWDYMETNAHDDRTTIVFQLQRTVMGAKVEKIITLIAGHPFIYQEHRFTGGEGAVSAAHHVMVHMQDGGDLAFSPKTRALTPADPLEPDPSRGRSLLAYPAQTTDLTAFPLAGGGVADLTHYPPGDSHEDFVTLVEAPEQSLGWSVVSRKAEQDRIIVLKCPENLPVTMMWMSNGGRNYAPWSGLHTGVLGIEDARASPLGHSNSCKENEFTRAGAPTAFELGGGRSIVVRQVIGACAAIQGESKLTSVSPDKDSLILGFECGGIRALNYAPEFLQRRSGCASG